MLRRFFTIVHSAVSEFFSDRGTQFAAALSFYAAFSMAPLLVMMLTVLALILDATQARDYLIQVISTQLGDSVARTLADMIDQHGFNQGSGMAALVAGAAMLIGATAVIMSMKSALDHIFGGHDHASARELWMSILIARFKSFLMVLILAVLVGVSLLLSVIANATTAALASRLPEWLQATGLFDPTGIDLALFDPAALANTLIGMTLMVAMLYIFYRFFPDRPPARLPALIGALAAAILLWLGRGIIGWYVATVGSAWAFGAAGALAVVLIWIFVSACAALLGAECAKCMDRDWSVRS